jgi:hypothetical protein
MIVWGGSHRNDGGRYDPATDTWRPTSIGAGVPFPGQVYAAVWTGSEMIVWGADQVQDPWSGGRYRPSSDSWTATSPSPLAIAGSGYSSLWTGSRMLLWGYDRGAAYDPSSDAWSLISTVNAPSPRTGPSVVWTGSEMIVWGGQDENGYANTGARYSPLGDTWSPTSTAGAPAPRAHHSAVWTGDGMIVYGGPGSMLNGGRYRPPTDSWTLFTGSNALVIPELSDNLTLWDGSRMTLWSDFAYEAGGASYCGCPNGRLVYRDADGDGFGVAGVPTSSCDGTIPTGYVANDADCLDTDGTVHPGGSETCNGLDDDCDGTVDEGVAVQCDDANPCTNDACGGAAGCTHAANSVSCDDGNPCTAADACHAGTCAGSLLPLEVGGSLHLTGGSATTLSWDPAEGASTSSVLRGVVSGLPVGATPASETCLASREPIATTERADGDVPFAGDAFWYLVRGEGTCGTGPYGYRTGIGGAPVAPEVSATCP